MSPAAIAERLYAERRRRDQLFPAGLFGEPAWDLLLALLIAREKQQPIILSAAYRAGRVTDTTGRRLVEALEAEGLIRRRRAPDSKKARLIELTEEAVDRMTDYLNRPCVHGAATAYSATAAISHRS